METFFFEAIKMINGEVQMTEVMKSLLDERKSQLTDVMGSFRLNADALSLGMDQTDAYLLDDPTDGYIITAASLAKINPIGLPDDTDDRLVFLAGYAVIFDLIEGLYKKDTLMRAKVKVLAEKIEQFKYYKSLWEPFIKKEILDTIPIEPYQSSFDDFANALMASIRPNDELSTLSGEDFQRILMYRAVEIKEQNSHELEKLTTVIRKAIRQNSSDTLSVELIDSQPNNHAKLEAIKNILDPLTGNNPKRKEFIIPGAYNRLYDYVTYLVMHTAIPKNIQPIRKTEALISNEYIMYTFHRLYLEIYGAKHMKATKDLFSIFLQKAFEGLSTYETTTIYKKLSQEPKGYKIYFG